MRVLSTFAAALALSLTAMAVAQAGERTTIHHNDGSRTEVRSDRQGTIAERSNGGSHTTGDNSHQAHERMVREHTDRGDRVEHHK